MLFFSEFKHCIAQLTHAQRNIILRNIVLLNIIFIVIVFIFAVRIQRAKILQTQYINSKIIQQHIPTRDLAKIHDWAVVDAKVYLFYIKDINLKDVNIPVSFALSMTYPANHFPKGLPDIDLSNGTVLSKTEYYKNIESGQVSEVDVYDAEITPSYQLQLYPLDKQLIMLRPAAKDWIDSPYFLNISGMYVDKNSLNPSSDYALIKSGYNNPFESYSMIVGHKNKDIYNVISRGYMVFDHKNIYTYIKNIQYIILSILIALFSLLINSKTNSPKNGRVAVIGSSVFSLAANVFQINSAIKPSNVFTLIDLITIFAGLIILICFTATIKTLKLLDSENYETAKAFDLSVFYCLLSYCIIFFVAIYTYT
jgi:hypothetical protein